MKKILLICVATLVFLFISGCTMAEKENESKTHEVLTDTTYTSLNLYKVIAGNYLNASRESVPEWETAEITGEFVWYNPLVEGPAYVEYKVTDAGKDAGYIIVSATDLDYPVPQYHMNGKAIYEMLAEDMETTPENVYGTRFDDFSYMGELKNTARSGKPEKTFFGTHYRLNYETSKVTKEYEYSKYLNEYVTLRKEMGAISDKKEYIDNYFKNRKAIDIEGENTMRSMMTRGSKPKAPYSTTKKTTIKDRATLLPKYRQYHKTVNGNTFSSGCSPTAAAMVLGYWQRRTDKKFFDATPRLEWVGNRVQSNLTMKNEIDVIEKLRAYFQTDEGSTDRASIATGLRYFLNDKHYMHNIRYYEFVAGSGGETLLVPENSHAEWNAVHSDIDKNYPAILSYNSPGPHSAVIFSSKIWQNEWTGAAHSVEYSIYTGWGESWSDESETTVNSNRKFLYAVIGIEIGNKY